MKKNGNTKDIKWSTLTMLLILSLIGVSKSYADWGFPEDSDIVMLDIFSHDRFIAEYPEAMVYYFIDDCAHCVDFKPIYSRLALDFKETKKRIPLANFDCTEHTSFCSEQLIPVFPFIKFFVKQHPIIYSGKREYKPLHKYLKYMTIRKPDKMKMGDLLELDKEFFNQPEIDTSLFEGEELKAEMEMRLKRSKSVLGVYFGKKSKNNKLFHIYDFYFKYDPETEFTWVKETPQVNGKNIKILGDVMSEVPSLNGHVVLFFNNKSVLYNGPLTFDGLEKAVHDLKYPKVNFINPKLYKQLGSKRMRLMLLFVNKSDDSSIRAFSRLANQYVKKFKFIVVSDDSEHGEIVVEFKKLFLNLKKTANGAEPNIQLKNNAQLRIVQMSYSIQMAKKYVLREPFEYQSGLHFIVEYNAKKLKPFVKCELLKDLTVKDTSIQILNSDSYVKQVKVPGQASIVLYHGGLDSNDQTQLFLNYMIELSNEDTFRGTKFFIINGEKNELGDFYDDEHPVLLIYSPKNLQTPLIYNKYFSKMRILKTIKKMGDVLNAHEHLDSIVFGSKTKNL